MVSSLTILCFLLLVSIRASSSRQNELWKPCGESECKIGTIVKLLVPEQGLPIGQLTQIVETSTGPLLRVEDPTPFERDDLWISRAKLGHNPLWEAIEAREKKKKKKASQSTSTRSRFTETGVSIGNDDEEGGAEDDYLSPYFKRDKMQFTYFDYDNFGTSPSHIDKLRMDAAMKEVMKKGTGATVTLSSSAKNLMRDEISKIKNDEEKKTKLAELEAKQALTEIEECTFRCQKSFFRTQLMSFSTSHQVCTKKEDSDKWQSYYFATKISKFLTAILDTWTYTQKTFDDIENEFTPEVVLGEIAGFGWKFIPFSKMQNMRCKLPVVPFGTYSENCVDPKTKEALKYVAHGVECKLLPTKDCPDGTTHLQLGICQFGHFENLDYDSDVEVLSDEEQGKAKPKMIRGKRKKHVESHMTMKYHCIENKDLENPKSLKLQHRFWTSKNDADTLKNRLMESSVVDKSSERARELQKIAGLKNVVLETLKMLGMTVTVVCDPPENADDALNMKSACETDACGKKAVKQCMKDSDGFCDSSKSGSITSLVSPLRECIYRCQDNPNGEEPEDCLDNDMLPIFIKLKCASCQSHNCQRMVTAKCTSKKNYKGNECRSQYMHDVVPPKGLQGSFFSYDRQASRFLTSRVMMNQLLMAKSNQKDEQCVFQCSRNTRLPFEDTTCRDANGHCIKSKEKCVTSSDCDPNFNVEDKELLVEEDTCSGYNKNTARPLILEPITCTSCSDKRCVDTADLMCKENMPRDCKIKGATYKLNLPVLISAQSFEEEDETQCSYECIEKHGKPLEIEELLKLGQDSKALRKQAVRANVACKNCESEICSMSAVKKCDEIVSDMAEICSSTNTEDEKNEQDKDDEKNKHEKNGQDSSVKIGICQLEEFPCFHDHDCKQYTLASGEDLENEMHSCLEDPQNIDWNPCSISNSIIDESGTKKALVASFTVPEGNHNEYNEPPQMTNFAPEDTTSKVDKSDFENPMSLEVSQERGLADELQSRIDYQRWLSFAKSNRTGCDSYPFCNHIPNPPPLMPHPLDLSVPRVGVKSPYVPPNSGDAPKYRWDLSQFPARMDKTQSVPDINGHSTWLKPPGGLTLTPGAGYGMPVQNTPIQESALRNMYDVGEKLSEHETNPYTKSGKEWGHQYNLYRKSMGLVEDPKYQMKAEGEAYPDLTDPAVSPDEWNILQGQDFDVFDAFQGSGTIKGRGSEDVDILTHSIGDIPDAPLTEDRRHESFFNGVGSNVDLSEASTQIRDVYDAKSIQTVVPDDKVENKIANAYSPISWDKNMKDNAAIAQPAAAKQYLSEMGLEEDCTVMTDPKLRAKCEETKKESLELPSSPAMRFRSTRKTLRNGNHGSNSLEPRSSHSSEINIGTFDFDE